MFATCLADFFNLRLWSHGQEPGYNDIRLGLEELTSATMEALTNARKNVNELTIRLYGGWHGELPESGRHILAITSAVIREFPRHVGTRLRIQIADSPIWDPSLRMVDSVKQVPIRLPDCSISHNPHCINPTNCSISILQSWWNGRCPEKLCRVRIEELGFMYRQKMVDTLLTADAITIVRDELSDILLIASDDDDMLPAMLAISQLQFDALLMRRRNRQEFYYSEILNLRHIPIHIW